jgi:hypothetical protein
MKLVPSPKELGVKKGRAFLPLPVNLEQDYSAFFFIYSTFGRVSDQKFNEKKLCGAVIFYLQNESQGTEVSRPVGFLFKGIL